MVSWLQIPQKLYGREKHQALLLSAFERAGKASPETILVSGPSGIGKTALVKSIQKAVIETKGYFLTGKFDQFNKNIPYASIIQAFRELIRQLVSESEERLDYWKLSILEALGANAQIIIDVIPEVEIIIGKQPGVAELNPTDAQKRFDITFLSFVKVFAKRSHPLVIFLDDIQWADHRSLEIIGLIITGTEESTLLLIGSYRDNEVDKDHLLFQLFTELKNRNFHVSELLVSSLNTDEVSSLLADTFKCHFLKAKSLAELVIAKTNGNPFFVLEFVKSLCAENEIRFDSNRGEWTWEVNRIAKTKITDNVVELMAEKIKSVPDSAYRYLTMAAYLGNQFDLQTLADVTGKSIHETATALDSAINQGLVYPLGSEYKLFSASPFTGESTGSVLPQVKYRFIHDRIQQAAYSLIDQEKRIEVHLHIGRTLLRTKDITTNSDDIFQIANHLNFGRVLITTNSELTSLAQLNLHAGRKAKMTSAYRTALTYFNSGIDCLQERSWRINYQLTYALHLEVAESYHLCGNVEEAEHYFSVTLANAANDTDKVKVYEKKIHFYSNLSRFHDSYHAARAALSILKIRIPLPSFSKMVLVREYLLSKLKLLGKKTEELIHLPEIRDEKVKMAVKVISAVLKSAYQIAPELCVANAIKIVNLTLSYGHCEDNAIAFIVFGGIFQGGVLGKHHKGYEYGKLALELNNRFNFVSQESEVNFVFGYFSSSWVHHLKDTELYFEKALKAGLETGDFFHTGCACSAHCQNLLMRGVFLDDVIAQTETSLELVTRIQNAEAQKTISGIRQAAFALKGMTSAFSSFDDEVFRESQYVLDLKTFGSQHFAHFYFINKMQSLYLNGDYDEAIKVSGASSRYVHHSMGMFHMTEHYFYTALIMAKLTMAGSPDHGDYLKALARIHKKFEKWSKECPLNFRHKYAIISAELTKVKGGNPEEQYRMGIYYAGENDFTQDQALANELYGNFQIANGKDSGKQLLLDAYYCFLKWGAKAKVEKMKGDYDFLKNFDIEDPLT